MLFEPGIAENFGDPRHSLGPRNFVKGGKKLQVLTGRKTREKRSLGGHRDANLPPDCTGIAPRIEAAHAHRPRIGQ